MECYRIALSRTLGAVSFVGCGDLRISRATCDSRVVRPGDLFVAISGSTNDGRAFISDAIRRGAAAILSEQPVPGLSIPQCVVPNSRAAYARLSMALRSNPASDLKIAGVTGTNGKTTVTWLLRAIIEASGAPAGLLGTIEYSDGVHSEPASLTTPDSDLLGHWFSRMRQNSVRYCATEISSHALDQRRCAALELSAAAITNVTRDHLDYHTDAASYRRAKSLIGELLHEDAPLFLCIDDPGCRLLQPELLRPQNVIWYGTQNDAHLKATLLQSDPYGMQLSLGLRTGSVAVRTALTGKHNIQNLLAAAALAEQLEIPHEAIVAGLEGITAIPGRLERIDAGQPFHAFVDYAHTPDGLAECLRTVRSTTEGRVICVFGAGGNRDRDKRPLMAQAAEAADVVVVTSDNPRNERPGQIIEDICGGFSQLDKVIVCPDRAMAITRAVGQATAGDSVVIAGRGHERTQQIANRSICFDDRKVLRGALLRMMNTPQYILTPVSDSAPHEQIPA